MPEKYIRREGVPILVRHTGRTTLPQDPPPLGSGQSPAADRSRPAILCLHDAGLQSSVFADLLAAARPEGGAIAFDLPGHGRSGSLDSLPSIPAMCEVARWVGDWCRATRPVLVGHGMGALIALEWATVARDAVAGLVLCGAGLALGIADETIETMRRVTLGKAPRPFDPSRVCPDGGQEMMRRAYLEGIRTDPRATLVDLEASRAWADTSRDLGTIDCPVAIVSGSAEDAACRARAERLAESLPTSRISEIEAAAHFLPLEQPEALAARIEEIAEAA